ncbi:MAG TPA: hypothetical protein VGF94_16825 [Kofleriaceae bacterium]|jgi:peptidoglycan hydrolase CwlO-like protein
MTVDNSGITIEVLKGIRDEIRETREEIRETNKRVDHMENRIDARFDVLTQRIVESESRTSTALAEVDGTMRDVRDLLRDRFDLRDRVERCERDIEELKRAR